MIITILSGSNHSGSTTGRLCAWMAGHVESHGHAVHLFDVHARPLPLYTEDVNEWDDDNVRLLRTWMDEAHAIVLATPEYHGSLSGACKNAIDFLWPQFAGKPVMSVSIAGGVVGTSSLIHLQTIVRNVHGINSPEWVSLGGAKRELTETGEPTDAKTAARVRKACDTLLDLAGRLRAE